MAAIAALVLFPIRSALAQQVTDSWQYGAAAIRIVIVPSDSTPEALRNIAQQALEREAKENRLIRMVFGEDRGEALRHLGPKPTDTSLQAALNRWSQTPPPQGVIAELLSIDGKVRFYARTAQGIFRDDLLGSAAAFDWKLGSTTFHLAIASPYGPSTVSTKPARVDFFFVADRDWSRQSLLRLTRILTRQFPDFDLMLHFRRDHWFIQESGYPMHYPFIRPVPPPAASECRKLAHAVCYTARSGALECN